MWNKLAVPGTLCDTAIHPFCDAVCSLCHGGMMFYWQVPGAKASVCMLCLYIAAAQQAVWIVRAQQQLKQLDSDVAPVSSGWGMDAEWYKGACNISCRGCAVPFWDVSDRSCMPVCCCWLPCGNFPREVFEMFSTAASSLSCQHLSCQ